MNSPEPLFNNNIFSIHDKTHLLQSDLLPQHSQMLAASAIDQSIIELRGYRSLLTKTEVEKYGFTDSQSSVPTLLIPIWAVTGEIALYHHRPDTPRLRDGKLAKYEFPSKARMAIDVHPLIRDKVRDPHIPLFITEGIKKADAAISKGVCCIALPGVWNWRGTNEFGGKSILPDWEWIALKDSDNAPRRVYICFDSDVVLKAPVQEAMSRLAGFLRKRGAEVIYIYLPSGEDGSKVGLDDFFSVGHTTDDLMSLASSELHSIGESENKGRVSQATRLVQATLDADCELFSSPEGEAFARIKVGEHYEVWPLKSASFKDWLAHQFYTQTDSTPSTQAIQEALLALQGHARYDGLEHEVFVRLARHNDAIYLDLANKEWQVVEIDALGWRVLDKSPVMFRRSRGMLPLPIPESGGRLSELRRFVNISGEHEWALLCGFIVGVLKPEGPYPLLVLSGEQGTAKTTLARIIKSIIDPSTMPLRSQPRNEHDLAIAAHNTWLLAFDNLSDITTSLSDALCRLSTGGGFGTRELYANAEETLFNAMRPVILSSIQDVVTRSDLLDRTIILTLDHISESKRRSETDLHVEFEAMRPRILAGLLDAASTAINKFATVHLTRLPRMADFAKWATAAEEAFGLEKLTFIEAYMGNRSEAHHLALESSPLVGVLIDFIQEHMSSEWIGSSTMLLEELNQHAGHKDSKPPDGWPRKAERLSVDLKRLAPNLRQIGLDITWLKRSGKLGRRISVNKLAHFGDTTVTSDTSSSSTHANGDNKYRASDTHE